MGSNGSKLGIGGEKSIGLIVIQVSKFHLILKESINQILDSLSMGLSQDSTSLRWFFRLIYWEQADS